jgi:peptide deformylase
MDTMTPEERMQLPGILQECDPALAGVARPFGLPAEAEDARRVAAGLVSSPERVRQVHTFAEGAGLAAPQAGIGRAAAVIHTPEGETLRLLNPRIIKESPEAERRYEGCLSFFGVRAMVPRPLAIEVEHQDAGGAVRITAFGQGMAQLVCYEVDHQSGMLCQARMKPGVEPIPVAQYKGTGKQWTY